MSLSLLNAHPLAAARVGGVEVGELFFEASGLPDVKSFAVSLLEGGGDPVLASVLLPQACPAFVNPVLFEFPADDLNGLIGEGGDDRPSACRTRI
jgi:hypothetical protein